ncbi:MAG: AtpZ/AtpI family protein [Pseudomonadota bacterium]
MATLAFEAAMAPVLGAWLGTLADRRWGISPWGLGTGVVLGLAASIRILRDLIRRSGKEDGENTKQDHEK